MLDLRNLKEKTWDLTMFDGGVLNIKRPSQKMVIDMMGYEDELKDTSKPQKMLDAFVAMLSDILNNNTNGKVFSTEFVAENFDFTLGMAVVEGYMAFTTEINSDPN